MVRYGYSIVPAWFGDDWMDVVRTTTANLAATLNMSIKAVDIVWDGHSAKFKQRIVEYDVVLEKVS